MIDQQFVVSVERLRDDLVDLISQLHKKYPSANRQVVSEDIRSAAMRLAETWMVNISPRPDVQAVLQADVLGNLNVAFQRLLTFAEHATIRTRYDREIRGVLKRFSLDVVIPLKQACAHAGAGGAGLAPQEAPPIQAFAPTAFVGHSFSPGDGPVNTAVIETLRAIGIDVQTGERPKADKISEKVKHLIEQQHIFVGIFTRRDKIARRQEWTTSPWVIDEKAYAVAVGRKLILLKESGVGSIGGIQGDYEYIDFTRDALHVALTRVLQLFEAPAKGLKQ